MPYSLTLVEPAQSWDVFIQEHADFYTFLCSARWTEFNRKEGKQVFAFEILDNSGVKIGQLMLVLHRAKRGSYFLSPHGPLISKTHPATRDASVYGEILHDILPTLQALAREHVVIFWRVNGLTPNWQSFADAYRTSHFRPAPLHAHVEDTHLLSLEPSEEELKAQLRQTTRYMINRADKEGVNVVEDNSPQAVELFYQMHLAHARRTNGKHNYTAFSRSYIQHLFDTFESDIRLFRADFEGRTEAIVITISFGAHSAYYLAASDIHHPKFSPAYICQWHAILAAKTWHSKHTPNTPATYNFWGVSPDDNPTHPLQGVSTFKRGFGGQDYSLLHAQDYAFSWKYWINYGIELWRRWRRKYYFRTPEQGK